MAGNTVSQESQSLSPSVSFVCLQCSNIKVHNIKATPHTTQHMLQILSFNSDLKASRCPRVKSSPNMNVAKKKMAKYSNFVLPFHNVISRYFMSSSSLKAHTIPIELNWQHQDPASASKPALVNFFNVPKISKESEALFGFSKC